MNPVFTLPTSNQANNSFSKSQHLTDFKTASFIKLRPKFSRDNPNKHYYEPFVSTAKCSLAHIYTPTNPSRATQGSVSYPRIGLGSSKGLNINRGRCRGRLNSSSQKKMFFNCVSVCLLQIIVLLNRIQHAQKL